MLRRGRWWCALVLVAGLVGPAAAELRPFTAESLAAIKEEFTGRPFILTLWSLTCTHCAKELRTLGQLAQADRRLPLVVVSTDTPADAPALQEILKRNGLGRVDARVYADTMPERLNYAIDPAWHGELPRTYLFDAAHRREAHSGLLSAAQIRGWLKRQRSSAIASRPGPLADAGASRSPPVRSVGRQP